MSLMKLDRRMMMHGGLMLGLAAALPRAALAGMPDLSNVKTRTTGKVEVLYKTPHYGPNGLWMSDEGMWIIHQIDENYATLIDIDTGKVKREIVCQGIMRASGICIDDRGVMWIGSTYNRLMVACNAKDGSVIAKYSTPGAGQIFAVKGDVAGSRTTLEPAYPAPPPSPTPHRSGRIGAGLQEIDAAAGPVGTGAHCPIPKGNLLYVDVPPARTIFAIDRDTWQVQNYFSTAGNRPHDMAWADDAKTRLWCSDSNMNAFFLHDAETGQILERVNLPDGSPIIHGAKMHNGYMYMCDDVGWMSRVRI